MRGIIEDDDPQPVSIDPAPALPVGASPELIRAYIKKYAKLGDVFAGELDEKAASILRDRIIELLIRYAEVFMEFPADKDVQHVVNLKVRPDAVKKYIPSKHLPSGSAAAEALKKELDKQVRDGILEPVGAVAHASPVLAVPKRIGDSTWGIRIVGNFVYTNTQTDLEIGVYPLVEATLDKTRGYTIFTSIDLKAGYHQFLLDPACRDWYVISTQFGNYRYRRMPMGPKNAPAAFMEVVNKVLAEPLADDAVAAFFDDLLVKSKGVEAQLVNLERVLKCLQANGLRANITKCCFFQRKASFLGQLVDGTTRKPDPDRLQGLRDMQMPFTVKAVQTFVGLANYYAPYVSGLAELLIPFNDFVKARKANSATKMPAENADLFERVKTAILEARPLAIPDVSQPFFIRTDASDYALGGVIMQRELDDKGRPIPLPDGSGFRMLPIAYVSRRFTDAQVRWSTPEKECFAIVYTLRKYERILRFGDLHLETDHKNLQWMESSSNPKVQRWAVYLGEFQYQLRHISGASNVIADGLSRVGVPAICEFVAHVLRDGTGLPSLADLTRPDDSASLLLCVETAQALAPDSVRQQWFSNGYRPFEVRGKELWGCAGKVLLPDGNADLATSFIRRAHEGTRFGGPLPTLKRLWEAGVTWVSIADDVVKYCGSHAQPSLCELMAHAAAADSDPEPVPARTACGSRRRG